MLIFPCLIWFMTFEKIRSGTRDGIDLFSNNSNIAAVPCMGQQIAISTSSTPFLHFSKVLALSFQHQGMNRDYLGEYKSRFI